MKSTRHASISILLLVPVAVLMTSCGARDDGTRFVPVSFFAAAGDNDSLARDLADYDQAYFASQIPGYDIPTKYGVIYGYFENERTGEVGLKLYSLVPSNKTQERLDAAEEGFSEFLPRLAELHVANRPLIESLVQTGREWLLSFSAQSVDEICRDETEFRLSESEYEKMRELYKVLSGANGRAQSVEFEKGQYYEAHDGVPETVSLFYMTKYEHSLKKLTRLEMSRVGEEWCVRSVFFGTKYQIGNNPKHRQN